MKKFHSRLLSAVCAVLWISGVQAVFGQTETPPLPGAPRSLAIPAVKEKRLANGLTVAVVERPSVPIVTVQLLVRRGASIEAVDKAGLANFTATMLTKGTKTRSATEIAQQIEFLGGTLDSGANWNSSNVTVTVKSDRLNDAMAILSDVVLNPVFDQAELDLQKRQALDGLSYNLKQPGFLGNYVASRYSFGEHPIGGTLSSLAALTRDEVQSFYSAFYAPDYSVLIFTGDISEASAAAMSGKYFGAWRKPERSPAKAGEAQKLGAAADTAGIVRRILVINLPNSGQAAVSFASVVGGIGRASDAYNSASVFNSVLGGGYSARLNQEIRIKRGLSYGAGSSFAWRASQTNFATRTQTKNESAAEVAQLVVAEIEKLRTGVADNAELTPRKSVLTGSFGRNLETTAGLASALGELYSFNIPATQLNNYIAGVNAVTGNDIAKFAKTNLVTGDIVIVGDYSMFKDDLAKRFPKTPVKIVDASSLDLTSENLTK